MSNEVGKFNPKNEITGKINQIDDVAMNVTVTPESRGIIEKLFPDKHKRTIAMHELELVKIESEFRERALKCARDAQLQSIQDMFNDYMVKGKATIRRERAEFFLEQFNAVQNSIRKASAYFEKETQRVWEDSEKISIPSLKAKKQQLIEQTIADFYNVVEKLKNNFENILNENVTA